MYTVLACAEMYLSLKGRKLSIDERKRLTLVGSMATICDDLIDEHGWNREQIFGLLSNQFNEDGLETKARFLVSLNVELNKIWPLQNKYLTQLKTALDWQAWSAKQLNQAITLDEIVHLCREKNGHTSLMFASLLDEDWDEIEKRFIYQSAIVGQLTNDSFDMYFDTQNGVYTYFNKAESITDVRRFLLQECKVLHNLVLQCNTSYKNKLNTIRRMSLLHGFTLTAIDQFQAVEKKYSSPINWKNIPRKELVVDMALNRNRLKTVKNIKWLASQY